MSQKRWYLDRTPPNLEEDKKEKLLKTVREEIAKIPKLKKAITNVRYYKNWVYLYHESEEMEGKNEILYRIAVFDEDYKNCDLEFLVKGRSLLKKKAH